jgi:hypothetical protein
MLCSGSGRLIWRRNERDSICRDFVDELGPLLQIDVQTMEPKFLLRCFFILVVKTDEENVIQWG